MRIHKLGYVLFTLLIATTSAPLLFPSFGSARVLAQTVDARKQEADRLLQQGIQQFQISQFEAALQSFQKALIIYREIKDRLGEGNALGSIGLAYFYLGDYAGAIDYQQQSLKIAREIKDRLGEGNALGNIGTAYNALGDYAGAIDYQQQALTILREIKDRLGSGTVLGNIGLTYIALGDYAGAIDYLQQRLKIAREIKDRLGEGQSLGNIGNAYLYLGDYAKAIDYQQQHLKIAREIKDRLGEGQSLANIGLAYFYLGDYAGAIDYLQQRLKIAGEIKDRLGEGNALGNIGLAHIALGDYPKAINYLQQRLKIVREIKDSLGEGQSLNNLGYALYKQGNLSSAESTLFEAIKVYESLRGRGLKDSEKVSISDTQRNTYRTLQQVLIAQNKTDAALEIAERSRARAFVELLASRISPSAQQLPTPPTIAEIQQTAKTHKTTLVQYSIIYDDFKVQGKQELKESELYIWVVKPTGEVTFRRTDLKTLWQKDNTDLYQLVTTVRNNIGTGDIFDRGLAITYNPDNTKTKINLRRLHKLLTDPIADLLPKNENDKIAFIAQDSLFLVPFPALQDDNGKYLIEKHTILTSPSIQVLDLTRKQREAQKTPLQDVLIVGNPTMPFVPPKIGAQPQQLPSLPGAEREAKAIGNLLNTKPLIGNEASKAAVLKRLASARFVHLATHGIFDNVQGINSSIALAPDSILNKQADNNGNGLLTAAEILNLKLNAELVVLSACDTGRGKITGDGVIGLSRAFISAGVPSVLVSLWSVPDAPTAQLMTEFYKNLQKNPDKAQALRQAMLTTMKNSPNPVDWAAFTLIGEAN